MKKGILMLGIVLAVMAVTAISGGVAAGSVGNTTAVTGSIVEATVTVTAPSAIAFGNFVYGDNIQQSATNGSVAITANSRNSANVHWQVTAADSDNGGYMKTGSTPLNSKLLISKDGSNYFNADTPGLTYTGTGPGSNVLALWAKQNITGNETVGSYSITITFTGGVTA
jgi:hypothetical protein